MLTWHEADTMKTVGRIIAEFRRLHIAQACAAPAFEEREAAMLHSRIGAIFINAGHRDGLTRSTCGTLDAEIFVDESRRRPRRRGPLAGAWLPARRVQRVASARAPTEPQFTYANLRAEAYARLRDRLVRGEVGLALQPRAGAGATHVRAGS